MYTWVSRLFIRDGAVVWIRMPPPHRLICFTSWSPASGTVWEGLGHGLVGRCHWESVLKFQTPTLTTASLSLSLLPADQVVKLSAPAPALYLPSPFHGDNGLSLQGCKQAPNKCVLYKYFCGHSVSSYQQNSDYERCKSTKNFISLK